MEFFQGMAGKLAKSPKVRQLEAELPQRLANLPGQIASSEQFQRAKTELPQRLAKIPGQVATFSGQVVRSPQFQQMKSQLPQSYKALPGGIASGRGKLLGAIRTGRETALGHMQTGRESLQELNTSREMIEEEIEETKRTLKNEASKSQEILTKQALWIVGSRVINLAKTWTSVVCNPGGEMAKASAKVLLDKVIDKLSTDITVPRIVRLKLSPPDEYSGKDDTTTRQVVLIELERLQSELLNKGICKHSYNQNERTNKVKTRQTVEYCEQFFKNAVKNFSFSNYTRDPNTDTLLPVVPFASTTPGGNLGSLFSGFFSGGKRRKTRRGRGYSRRRTTRKH